MMSIKHNNHPKINHGLHHRIRDRDELNNNSICSFPYSNNEKITTGLFVTYVTYKYTLKKRKSSGSFVACHQNNKKQIFLSFQNSTYTF